MKNLYILIAFYFLLNSCGTIGDAGKVMRNEKTKTTDEFLVKKRNPLVLPPNYENIPEPGSISNKKDNSEEENIKKILKAPRIEDVSKNKPSSIEESIIDRIRK
jgi:hypothetical protein